MEESKNSFFKSSVFYSTIFAFIVCFLAYYFLIYKPSHIAGAAKVAPLNVTVVASNEVDSDKDGLPDWKELVYGSNPTITDTDGDGILDGEEVASGHDPAKAGPDDILHNLSITNATSTGTSSPEQAFVSEFMSKEIENIRSDTVNNLVKNLNTSEIKPRYGLRDLNITVDNSEDSLRKYANAFGVIIKKYTSTGAEDESTIMARAISTKRASDLQKIELPAIAYRNFAEELRKIETPSIIAEHHLNAVSGYDVMSRSLFLTEKLFSNPMEGSAGWQMYLTQIMTVTRGYAGIINVLHDKNVIFDISEPGYHFRWPVESINQVVQKNATTSNTNVIKK